MERYREVIEDLSLAYRPRGYRGLDEKFDELKENPPSGLNLDTIERVVREYLRDCNSSPNTVIYGEFPKNKIIELSILAYG